MGRLQNDTIRSAVHNCAQTCASYLQNALGAELRGETFTAGQVNVQPLQRPGSMQRRLRCYVYRDLDRRPQKVLTLQMVLRKFPEAEDTFWVIICTYENLHKDLPQSVQEQVRWLAEKYQAENCLIMSEEEYRRKRRNSM